MLWSFDLEIWLGTYTNAKKKIKQNLQKLLEQNELQEAQMFVSNTLKFIMVQVHEHCGVLHELDTRLVILNKTLISTMKTLSHVRYMPSLLKNVCTALTQFT